MSTTGKIVAVAGGALLLFLFGRKKAAAPAAVEQKPLTTKPKGGAAELSNGNFARFTGDVNDDANQTYVRCETADGVTLGDAACSLVRMEFPEIKVPLNSLIRMTEGRRL